MKKTIAERIAEGLNIRGMKQADLVDKTGIGKSSISTYISGAYEPKQKNIYKIAKALNVNEAWLMGYDVQMEKQTHDNSLSNEEIFLLKNFNKLNDIGKKEASKRVSELTEINKYILDDSYTFAAHDDNLDSNIAKVNLEKAKSIFDEMDKED